MRITLLKYSNIFISLCVPGNQGYTRSRISSLTLSPTTPLGGCVDYVSNGTTIDGCLKGTERYTGKVVYENALTKTLDRSQLLHQDQPVSAPM